MQLPQIKIFFFQRVNAKIFPYNDTHLCAWLDAVDAAALENDDVPARPTRIHDGALGFALEDSEVLGPAVLASKTGSASPCHPCSPVSRPGPVRPAAAAAATIYPRDRGDRAHLDDPGHRDAAATAVARQRRAAYPAAFPDATAW